VGDFGRCAVSRAALRPFGLSHVSLSQRFPPLPLSQRRNSVSDDFNAVWDARPATPTCDTPVEVTVVGRRCVYVNDYRIAGGKPYVSEQLPSHVLKTTLGDILEAFGEREIRKALREKKARRDYFAAYHTSKKQVA